VPRGGCIAISNFFCSSLPFRERASTPKPSLESSHKTATGSFATLLARRSRARHFHTRGWYFHARFTPPRARTSTTKNINNNSSAAFPPAALAFLVDALATLAAAPAMRTPSTAKPQPSAPRGGGRVNAESADSVAAIRTAATVMRGRWGRGGSAASAGGGVGLGTWNEDGQCFSEIPIALDQ
jgi:hypothetical protein